MAKRKKTVWVRVPVAPSFADESPPEDGDAAPPLPTGVDFIFSDEPVLDSRFNRPELRIGPFAVLFPSLDDEER